MVTVTLDKAGWERKYRGILKRRAYARAETTIVMARGVCRIAYETAPVDTGRYKKNLAQAANSAGVGPLAVGTTRRSRFADKMLPRLQEEISYWTHMDELYQRESRTAQPYYQKILKRRAKAELELRRFEETEDAIVLNALGGKRAPSVRYKNYTGRGWITQLGDQTVVTIHNTEAHASLVEWRHKTMRLAINAVRSAGGSIKKLANRKWNELVLTS